MEIDDDEPPVWSLSEHLSQGRVALDELAEAQHSNAEPICHHFCIGAGVDPDAALVHDAYAPLEPLFAELGMEFESVRLEAWEAGTPTLEWLNRRIPELFNIAEQHGLYYEGWTWEPQLGQPIGACTFSVINNRSGNQTGQR